MKFIKNWGDLCLKNHGIKIMGSIQKIRGKYLKDFNKNRGKYFYYSCSGIIIILGTFLACVEVLVFISV